MRGMVLARATVVWLVMLVLMVLNGLAREKWLTARLGELRAHQVSCLTGSLLSLAATTLSIRWLKVTGNAALLCVGAYWVVLTVAWEIFMGRVLMKLPWERVWADYNLAQGRLWPAVLVVIFFAPLVAVTVRRWIGG
jgi:hypothetical protein